MIHKMSIGSIAAAIGRGRNFYCKHKDIINKVVCLGAKAPNMGGSGPMRKHKMKLRGHAKKRHSKKK